MKVGYLQMNPRMLAVRENVEAALRRLARVEADLIVLPELFNTGYNFRSAAEVRRVAETIPGPTTAALSMLARAKGCAVVAGMAERDGARLYNSAVLVTPTRVERYRKIHLFKDEKRFFSPGNLGFQVWTVRAAGRAARTTPVRVGVMVCFDWFFPESMRTLALKGAEIVAHPANLVLPYCPEAMKTRCLENRVFAVTADRVGTERGLRYIGRSQVVDTRGRVLKRAGAVGESSGVVSIEPGEARAKRLNRFNDLLGDRRPSAYAR